MKQIIILLAFSLSAPAMETPVDTETVPVKLQALHNKEYNKFKKYNLKNPDTFVQLIRQKLGYEENKQEYAKQLQLLLSRLWAQHQAMRYLGESIFFTVHQQKLIDQFDCLLKKLNAKDLPEGLDLKPNTPAQLSILLAHPNLFHKRDLYSPEELSLIFSWIVDSEKGAWLNSLGLLFKVAQESRIAAAQGILHDQKAESVINLPPFEMPYQFIADNFPYLNAYYVYNANYLGAPQITDEKEKSKSRATLQLAREITDLTQLYRIHQTEYQLLYTIVKQELFTRYQQSLSSDQKIPVTTLLPLPEESRKQNIIPSKFPDKLETIKNPSTYLILANLDAEVEKARIEWEKNRSLKPKARKKNRRRKKVETEIPESSTTPADDEVKKIKVGPDNSYIAQDTEDDLAIVIEDPVNDTTVTIYKAKVAPAHAPNPRSIPNINYTRSVNEWFENPKMARINQGHTDPKNPRYRAGEPEWKPIVLHAFPLLVDDYIFKYGTVSKTPSRITKDKNDIMITIPGKMEYPDGTEETGVFTYIIDSENGQWYHRMFTPSSHKKMAEDFMQKGFFTPEIKGYYDVYFPPLTKP